jgi:hypothetical protein
MLSPAGALTKKPVSVGFLGHHRRWSHVWNDFTAASSETTPLLVTLPSHNEHLQYAPDFLFYSVFGELHRDPRYNRCVKIFSCQECFCAPWGECDYALTGDYSNDPRHLRYPVYMSEVFAARDVPPLRHPCLSLVKDPGTNWEDVLAYKTNFCCFVYSNELWRDPRSRGECGLELRIKFFELLSKYKRVDAAGRVCNNTGYQVQDKLPYVERFKFTVAFENTSYPGYVTEKLVDPMFALSVPIYWGNPEVADDFNPASMVVATGRRLEDVVNEVVALDQDNASYLAKLREPWFHGNVPNKYCSRERLGSFLSQIYERGRKQ